MLIIKLEPNKGVLESPIKLAGMRAAITGSINLAGLKRMISSGQKEIICDSQFFPPAPGAALLQPLAAS